MAIELNHLIVPARDGEASARWLADLFALAPPTRFSVFWQVSTDNGVDIDFDTYGDGGAFTSGHYAFLVAEQQFDEIYGRIVAHGIEHWADPARGEAGTINRHDGGRGVYFASPDGHLLEIITRPYGS